MFKMSGIYNNKILNNIKFEHLLGHNEKLHYNTFKLGSAFKNNNLT